jgi:hypothetical protein
MVRQARLWRHPGKEQALDSLLKDAQMTADPWGAVHVAGHGTLKR